ncbi:Peroxisomal membrane protein PEX14 [Spatholobus suberectus]|nr:Peroxisomal membrane protein PEX14 [Spatholobus suberectus]
MYNLHTNLTCVTHEWASTIRVRAHLDSSKIKPKLLKVLGVFHWFHALIAVGLLAALGAEIAVIIKNSILLQFKSWICKVILDNDDEQLKKTNNKSTLTEEVAQAAKSTVTAAADVVKAGQEILASKDNDHGPRRKEAF